MPIAVLCNSANYNNNASWNPSVGPSSYITTVGSNGGPSYYGTYDQAGLLAELIYNDTNTPTIYYNYVGGDFSTSSINVSGLSSINLAI